jgi:REP element-mobilizing transposase RayT
MATPSARSPAPRRTAKVLRLADPDHRGGAIFLTLCAATREPLFGWLTGDRFLPSRLGLLVRESWLNIPVLHPGCGLDVFCLMPDHFHAVLHARPASRVSNPVLRGVAAWRGGVGTIVNQFKGAVARAAAIEGIVTPGPLWQRGYFERVIRDAEMLGNVRTYILRHALRNSLHQGLAASG